MNLYKPSALKAFLAEIGAAPIKFLSQNFLIDGNIVRKIVRFADVNAKDSVLEIGPGPGVLTEELLAHGAHVFAVEKDRKFASALTRLQTEDKRLIVFEDDALKWDFASHLKQKTKLVANLPYNITTPILTHFLPRRDFFQTLTVMVQKEVAERLLAHPGSKAYGSLSVFVQFYSDPIKGFIVEPTCFYPAPKVQSAVVQFRLKVPPITDEDHFFEMTRCAFGQRRKMVHTTLKKLYPLDRIEEGLTKVGKGLKVRPEELSLADFLVLFEIINQK
jgi:16S rRNA (adenine1518-N6/adenine1519-N6)-dimethyltransferase